MQTFLFYVCRTRLTAFCWLEGRVVGASDAPGNLCGLQTWYSPARQAIARRARNEHENGLKMTAAESGKCITIY